MTYIQRIDHRPVSHMTPEEEQYLANHFDAYGSEAVIEGQIIPWRVIEEVEVVVAPHAAGLAGWLVKALMQRSGERYHVGVYFGAQEAVLPNITWEQARYVLENIAYYAPNRITYTGPEDLVPLTEI